MEMHPDTINSWAQLIVSFGSVIAMFKWTKDSSSHERKNMDEKMEQYRRDLDEKTDRHRKETLDILLAIQSEIKDFHGRLISLEERGRK